MHHSVELITIGDELLYGQTIDTNASWISHALGDIGLKVVRKTTIGDNEKDILAAFEAAEQRATIVLITGGLGPTNDDRTKPCLSKYFNSPLIIDEEALEEITAFFKQRGKELTELNKQQSALPACCTRIANPLGTAPGMYFERDNIIFFSMPGVPHEMKNMMQKSIVPMLEKALTLPALYHTMIRTVGLGESFLADQIKPLEDKLPHHFSLAYLPGLGEVKLRLTASGQSNDILKEEATKIIAELDTLIGKYIYSYTDESIEAVVGKMLTERSLTLAAAESCTGGYLSHKLTSTPGSSHYFPGSVVSYANEVKITELGIARDTLEQHGAVSEAVVKEMARGARAKFKSDLGIAISGIAGPNGGTPDKPVGLVWVGLQYHDQVLTKHFILTKNRILNIKLATLGALNMVRIGLLKFSPKTG